MVVAKAVERRHSVYVDQQVVVVQAVEQQDSVQAGRVRTLGRTLALSGPELLPI